jgi:hypothetical protein
MKAIVPGLLLFLLLGLSACGEPKAQSSPEAVATLAATAVPPPTSPSATASPSATEPATVTATASGATVPRPSLFDVGWDDRSPFVEGLIETEETALAGLPGASVYHVDFTLDEDLAGLTGRQEVLYSNREAVTLDEVYFRLFPELADGSTAVSELQVNGQPVTPDYELQDSAMRVPLPQPLAPGEQAVISMAFAVEVPTEGGGNYGTFIFAEDILALAHFYPMIAVYDDEGWNVEIAPPSGDVVYADSSFYLVRVTAPAELTLVASGVAVESSGGEEQQSVTYAAGPMRDFYLVAATDLAVESERVGPITVNSYASSQFKTSNKEVLGYATVALERFNERFGAYPFTEFDVVSTPTQALGVEYPGIIVINNDLYDPETSRFPPRVLESTVVHEVAHQWFYSIIGNDQLDDPWLDESLVQYATYLYFLDAGDPGEAAGFQQDWVRRWEAVDREEIPIGLPVAAYDGAEYSAIVYGRGPLFFDALSQAMGSDDFLAFLRDYYQTLTWDIATPERLQALAEEHCGCDLDSLFEKWVYAN